MLIHCWAGYHLTALGRPLESIPLTLTALELAISAGTSEDSTIAASNLADLYLLIGDLTQALNYNRQSVALADLTGYKLWPWVTRASLGNALHQAGRFEEANAAFVEAEQMLKKGEARTPFLYSYSAYEYCELLLRSGNYKEVFLRASVALEIAKPENLLLDIAVHNLSLGRSSMLAAVEANT
jgi:tetratricopeptide (TPR) repeat protein